MVNVFGFVGVMGSGKGFKCDKLIKMMDLFN